MTRALLFALAALAASLAFAEGDGPPRLDVEVVVDIPERLALVWGRVDDAAASAGSALRAPSAEHRSAAREIGFDLACATLGALPARCDGERLLDHRGRPYPPVLFDRRGDLVPGSMDFPSVFAHAPRDLVVFSNTGYQLFAEVRTPPSSPDGHAFGPERFAVRSVRPLERSIPPWRCLGWHPGWSSLDGHACPDGWSPGEHGTRIDTVDAPGVHWHRLGVELLLDGSERPGTYRGEIVYTVVKF